MTAFSPELLAEIRSRLPLARVISRHVSLKRSGRSWRGRCPFHTGGKTPRPFSVLGNHYRCWSCGERGDVYAWTGWREGVGFIESVRRCAAEAGVDLPKHQHQDDPVRVARLAAERAARLTEHQRLCAAEEAAAIGAAIADAQDIWRECVPLEGALGARHLVEQRGIPRPASGWPDCLAWHTALRMLVAAGTTDAGEQQFIHRIYLYADGQNARRPDGSKRKTSRGVMNGAAIRLPGTGDTLHAEGLETGLSAWVATGNPVFVYCGAVASRLQPQPGCNIVLRDDDPIDSTADRLLIEAAQHWREAGISFAVAQPWPERRGDKSDFNDTLREAGPEAVAAQIAAARSSTTVLPRAPATAKDDSTGAGSKSFSDDSDAPVSDSQQADRGAAPGRDQTPPPGWESSHPGRGDSPFLAAPAPRDPILPNGSYLRPGDTNVPVFHPPITESRTDAEYRLDLSIGSFLRIAERVQGARREQRRRRAEAIAAAMEEAGREGDLTEKEKAAITRRVSAQVAAEYGFPSKLLPRPARQLESGSQGNGKTRRVLIGVAAIRAELTVHKYAPTLAQAEEDATEYRRIATEASMPGFVVRGRGAADPQAGGMQMCRRFKTAERIARLGISPAQTICIGCKFATVCGTKRQEQTIEALGTRAVFFLSREYAHLPCPAPAADIIIGDEQMTLPAVVITSMEPEKLTRAVVPYRGRDMADVMEAGKTLERMRAPLMSAEPLAAIHDAKISKDMLRRLRQLLDDEKPPHIDGKMTDAEIESRLDAIDKPDQRHALAIVRAVLREIDIPDAATFNAVRYNKRRNLIETSRPRHLHGIKRASVLLLDGTGDAELNEKLLRSKITHNVVRMERDAEIYGSIGRRYSRQSQTGQNAKGEDLSPERVAAAKRLRDEIGQIASHFTAPLVTAPKQAAEALIDGGHLPADAAVSWPGLTRGRNEWEDRETAISAGPASVSIEEAELLAGAFYARDPVRIVSMARMDDLPADWPYKPWPYVATRLRRFDDPDKLQIVQVDVHPDPRVQRVIEQIREAGVIQDIDRVRPIYNHRVQVPLNELVLDLSYNRVMRHRELVEGGTRIDRVLRRSGGVLPLTPAVLAALFPTEAGSVSTARRAVRAWRKWGQGPNRSPIWGVTPT